MDKKTAAKLARLLDKFPESWTHTKDARTLDDSGKVKVFHHVDFTSKKVPGRRRVRLVSYVSADMCELIVTLKDVASEFVAIGNKNGDGPAAKAAPSPSRRRAVPKSPAPVKKRPRRPVVESP